MANLEMLKNLSAVYEHMEEVVGKSRMERKNLLSICEEMEDEMLEELVSGMYALGQYARKLVSDSLGKVFFKLDEGLNHQFGYQINVCFMGDGQFRFFYHADHIDRVIYDSFKEEWRFEYCQYDMNAGFSIRNFFAVNKDAILSHLEGVITEAFENAIQSKLDNESEKANNLMVRYELLKQIKNEEGDNT